MIGDVPLGGNNPVRIQSMTNTNTMDTQATVKQVIHLVDAGCEYVRLTTQGLREAGNLKNIKNELKKRGYAVPLIADVHFNPKVAELAAQIVEKVRINPGNYSDRSRGNSNFSEKEYNDEISRIRKRIEPLLRICKKHGTVLRIGSNHGSLSERIMSRYGDSPEGMVESAMEFVRICRENDFHDIVLSMKSSNTRIMVQSTRLLVHHMLKEGMDWPIHLGVTEAGEGEDGRIKSAVGIGTLLEDGIGDTIRVSLTEDPVNEIPVAIKLAERYADRNFHKPIPETDKILLNPFEFNKRESITAGDIGGKNIPVVVNFDLVPDELNFKYATFEDLTDDFIDHLKNNKKQILVLETDNQHGMAEQRRAFLELLNKDCRIPVIIKRIYKEIDRNSLQLFSSIDIGGLFIDGLGDGIWIEVDEGIDREFINTLSLGILQASRVRFSKTEYIACPSCGRTMFDIQNTLKEIKARTGHLKNLKIGVMGCIVNGPGEMADTDFGYVGSAKGKITLYKGKKIIKKNIDESHALDELIRLIKEQDDRTENN